jgi:hypothetical protein
MSHEFSDGFGVGLAVGMFVMGVYMMWRGWREIRGEGDG